MFARILLKIVIITLTPGCSPLRRRIFWRARHPLQLEPVLPAARLRPHQPEPRPRPRPEVAASSAGNGVQEPLEARGQGEADGIAVQQEPEYAPLKLTFFIMTTNTEFVLMRCQINHGHGVLLLAHLEQNAVSVKVTMGQLMHQDSAAFSY
jgi:hypothetical protein